MICDWLYSIKSICHLIFCLPSRLEIVQLAKSSISKLLNVYE